MASLRKNTASQNITFQLIKAADGTPVTAGGAGNVSKDGGAQASCAGTFTHLGTGQWLYVPTQAETNAASVGFQFTGTGAISIGMMFFTDNWDTTQAVITSGSGTGQVSLSSGKIAGVVLVDTVTAYTGNTPQTGDAYARIGAAGAGLTALGDVRIAHLDADVSTRSIYAGGDTTGTTTLLSRLTATRAGLLDNMDAAISSRSTFAGGAVASVTGAVGSVTGLTAANLDAAVSSRMATYAQPTGFLAATFPGTVASPTNITAGTITNLTNAAGSGDFTAAMKTSLNAATPAVTVSDKTGFSLTQAFPSNFASLAVTSGGAVTIGAVATAATNLKKNTSISLSFPMTDSTDHAPMTGLTVTATRSIDGAAFAACTNAPSETGNGVYVITLAAADTNGNQIMYRFTAAGADDRLIELVTQP